MTKVDHAQPTPSPASPAAAAPDRHDAPLLDAVAAAAVLHAAPAQDWPAPEAKSDVYDGAQLSLALLSVAAAAMRARSRPLGLADAMLFDDHAPRAARWLLHPEACRDAPCAAARAIVALFMVARLTGRDPVPETRLWLAARADKVPLFFPTIAASVFDPVPDHDRRVRALLGVLLAPISSFTNQDQLVFFPTDMDALRFLHFWMAMSRDRLTPPPPNAESSNIPRDHARKDLTRLVCSLVPAPGSVALVPSLLQLMVAVGLMLPVPVFPRRALPSALAALVDHVASHFAWPTGPDGSFAEPSPALDAFVYTITMLAITNPPTSTQAVLTAGPLLPALAAFLTQSIHGLILRAPAPAPQGSPDPWTPLLGHICHLYCAALSTPAAKGTSHRDIFAMVACTSLFIDDCSEVLAAESKENPVDPDRAKRLLFFTVMLVQEVSTYLRAQRALATSSRTCAEQDFFVAVSDDPRRLFSLDPVTDSSWIDAIILTLLRDLQRVHRVTVIFTHGGPDAPFDSYGAAMNDLTTLVLTRHLVPAATHVLLWLPRAHLPDAVALAFAAHWLADARVLPHVPTDALTAVSAHAHATPLTDAPTLDAMYWLAIVALETRPEYAARAWPWHVAAAAPLPVRGAALAVDAVVRRRVLVAAALALDARLVDPRDVQEAAMPAPDPDVETDTIPEKDAVWLLAQVDAAARTAATGVAEGVVASETAVTFALLANAVPRAAVPRACALAERWLARAAKRGADVHKAAGEVVDEWSRLGLRWDRAAVLARWWNGMVARVADAAVKGVEKVDVAAAGGAAQG
ncbi:hypothetical protein AMAG_08251 [Allomyces macrogynus ATCC 38327]|uniref:Uncharacterized protein n=1 Tax=Allomyces macrogynus (strain ATCC 38327) TaxID=578462 RepID=A0A0L0SL28_ALLM3|nr:hypothetical protein AMAG_08251 [Allomyces macrogynus ATCC 38327]|eukprot:KNE63085.1 hypothetical protein AMAG_08251 [Allomyces macrogynus ATCC 38327]